MSRTKGSRTDALTGLPNRRSFFDDFDLNFGALHDGACGVIHIDLDGLRTSNDTARGIFVGDDLLRVVSRRFKLSLWWSRIMARLGGDEFAFAARADGAKK